MSSEFYHYLGKSKIEFQPLVDYLKTSIIPLYEDKEYREYIIAHRSEESLLSGFPPVFLTKDWKIEKQKMTTAKNFWCQPFSYKTGDVMFVIGGPLFLEMFPDAFSDSGPDDWTKKLQIVSTRPQIIMTNNTSGRHIDLGTRNVAVNTFLYNTDKTVTDFFPDSSSDKVESITYQPGDAYLINVKKYHQVRHSSQETRCVLSWSYECNFDLARALVK
jgi:hypothetical protein